MRPAALLCAPADATVGAGCKWAGLPPAETAGGEGFELGAGFPESLKCIDFLLSCTYDHTTVAPFARNQQHVLLQPRVCWIAAGGADVADVLSTARPT